ncbi:non-ribosomal peptide synthetase [Nocardia cyriacigeorgica]|uniref:Phenyloxazoline synthase MbtB n=2 Tax=Nocardia cyriacigeorgica TaxID=135487 RepID=A0A6P1D7T9_9NOCA|nr:non-ribosomal peptide synthetase [Nocardia cyriacigeorgica]NEW44292.1 amino acid adenylation domain-containing protein [Nocardia cyriacigeorgica]
MNPADLLGQLRADGVQLWIDGGDLRFTAPRGVFDAQRKAALVAVKAEVKAILAAETAVLRDPGGRYERFPLTDVQASYLVGRTNAFRWGGVGCHGYAEFEVDPARARPDAEQFHAAWHKVVERHDMLRCVVHPDGYQSIQRELDSGLTVHTRGTAEDIATLRRDVAHTLAHRTYTPGTGPMYDLVVTIGPVDTVVHLSIDLLIADFVSIAIVMSDFERCLLEPATELEPIGFGFRDYVLNLTRGAHSPAETARRQADLEYWTNRLDELPPPVALPLLAEQRSAAPSFTRRSARLNAGQWASFTARAAERGITPTAALLCAFGRVLGRYGDRDHFLLTLTTMGRVPFVPEVDRIVGDFTGTSVLDVDVRGTEPFATTARRLGVRLFEDMDHARVSGVDIVRMLARRDDERGQMSPVVFTSTLGAREQHEPALLVPRRDHGLSQTPQVLLDCQVGEINGAVEVNWDSRDHAIAPEVLDLAFADFTRVVTELCAEAGAWERTALPVTALPPTEVRTPAAPRLLHSDILRHAVQTPDAIALRRADETYTFAQLAGAAHTVAQTLRAAGVAPGDQVGVRLAAGPPQIAAILGVLMASAAYVPLDWRWPAARVEQISHQCDLAALIAPDDDIDRLLAEPRTWRPVSSIAAAVSRPHDPAYVIFTSGSTGRPKGVVMSHAAVTNTLDDINSRLNITAGDRVLAVSQHTFDLSVYNIFGVLGAGGCLVHPAGDQRADPEAWHRAIVDHQVTIWNSVPAQLQLLLEYAGPGGLASLRRVLLSGDWIPVQQPRQTAAAAPNAAILALGGATEAAIWSICHPVDPELPYQRSVPYGTAMTNQSVRVLTHRGEQAAPWQIGEIHIGGVGLSDGYLGDADRTAAAFVTHPRTGERLYRTGDYGRTLPGGVIELLGRRDTQVKIRGHRIELAEIDEACVELDGVRAAVTCVVGDRHTPSLAAAVVAEAADGDELSRRHEQTAATVEAARLAHEHSIAGLDTAALQQFIGAARTTALNSMCAALGTVLDSGARIDGEELAHRLAVTPSNRRLLRHWIDVLRDDERVVAHDDRIELTARHDLRDCVAEWAHVRELGRAIDYGDELLVYVGRCIDALPQLLCGDVDPLALLFPHGSTDTATAAYRDNLISRYANAVVVATVVAHTDAQPPGRPLRILEVGAGVGGTSAELIPALAGHDVRYTFSDVSRFFLTEAAQNFAAYEFVDYALFDLNAPAATQGFAPGSFDLVLCANVLHNAVNIDDSLAALHRLLAPGGALAFIDSTATNHALMISMEFKEGLDGFTDARAGGHSAFLSHPQWGAALERSPFGAVSSFPPAGHPLAQLGQHVFWCPSGSTAQTVYPDEVIAGLERKLPSYQVPPRVSVLPALPLTANGKLDRRALGEEFAQLVAAARDRPEVAATTGELEPMQARIAEIWAAVLGLPGSAGLTPSSDFFALGGDSLLLAQCIGRIRQEIPEAGQLAWDDLLRAMVSDPTLAAAAGAVRGTTNPDSTHTAPAAESPLVCLDAGDTGPGQSVAVLVHDGSGGLAPYQRLIDALRAGESGDMRLYGLRRTVADGYADIAPEELFETLAVRYAAAIVDLQPDRVHLVGYCMGGLVATEIAKILEESGISTAPVTVVSSYRVPLDIDDDDVLDYCFGQIMGAGPDALGLPADDEAFATAFTHARQRHPEAIPAGALRQVADPELAAGLARTTGPQRMRSLAASGALGTAWTEQSLTELRAIFVHSLRAVVRGARAPFLGDVHFLRQRGDIHFLPTLKDDMTAFWREYTLGTLTVTDIDGNHFDCLDGDNAATVAALLRRSWQQIPEVVS